MYIDDSEHLSEGEEQTAAPRGVRIVDPRTARCTSCSIVQHVITLLELFFVNGGKCCIERPKVSLEIALLG